MIVHVALQDEGAGVACSVLEDLLEAKNVNQVVRAMAVGVGAYCKVKVCLLVCLSVCQGVVFL
jgi:hypothetical protein